MKRKYSKAIRKIAAQHGISPAEVYKDMQESIAAGYNNPNPEVQDYWRRLAPDGKVPEPEEIIEVLVTEIQRGKK